MPRFKLDHPPLPGSLALLSGTVMAVCLAAIAALPVLRGPPLTNFLLYFLLAAAAYAVAVIRLNRAPPPLWSIWVLAILFRLMLLFNSPPTLSDDVYRYIWDGRLANAGVSPYTHTVDSPSLDRFDSPQRALVNNAWMASPYLPTTQVLFALVYRLAPDNPFALQMAAVLLDLLTGWLVTDLLRRLGRPQERALIYLWNPLVVVEFAHGAHIDALMICLMMLALWSLINDRQRRANDQRPTPKDKHSRLSPLISLLSPLALAAATLTKGLPALLLPVITWRWGWWRTLLYAGLIAAVLVPFALGAGWGLTGPRNGEGLFGALRIYTTQWNYNGGLYHWLEIELSGYRTPGAVPPEAVGEAPIRTAKLIVGVMLGLVLVTVAWKSRRHKGGLALLQLAHVPLGAYLLLTTTVHPWYVTLIVPLLPFLGTRSIGPGSSERVQGHPQQVGDTTRDGYFQTRASRLLWPWLYFSAAVTLSYLTYLDPANLREYDRVRLLEYVPFYLLLLWSLRPTSAGAGEPGAD